MRLAKTFAGLAVALLVAVDLHAQDQDNLSVDQVTFAVQSTMDVFQAGGNVDNSGGAAPVSLKFQAGNWSRITFRSIAGEWTCQDGYPYYGPDGETSGYCVSAGGSTNFKSVGLLSGYSQTDFVGPLAGVFLGNELPASPPAALRFYVNDSSEGGIPTDFQILNPEIGQVFFIGDGLTGTAGGRTQQFLVPSRATHLYLGYVDNCMEDSAVGPGCYGDNVGSMSVTATLHE